MSSKGESGGIAREDYDEKNNRNMKIVGKPNSRLDFYRNGILYQQRWYDKDGKPKRNRDYSDHGNAKMHPVVPHDHSWNPYRNPKWEYPDEKYE